MGIDLDVGLQNLRQGTKPEGMASNPITLRRP